MRKRFSFVNLDINTGCDNFINHGIAFLVPIVKKYGYAVEVIQLNKEIPEEEFRNRVEKLTSSIVGFSCCTSHQFKYLVKYSRALEKFEDILQIAGGVHSTLDPEGVLQQTSVQGACIGEGEIPLNNLLQHIENKKDIYSTPGFYWKLNGKIKKNPIPQFITDLSTLEFPDYRVFGRDTINCGDIRIILGRGCPYNCTYCCNSILNKVYSSSKNYFRIPSVKYSIKLLEKIIKEYEGIESITFEDDNLIAHANWLKRFAMEYKERINLPYTVWGRIECINHDIVEALRNSRCEIVCMGIETGSEWMRNNLLNRKYSNELIIENTSIIKKAGIKLIVLDIVGFPFETNKQMKETLKLTKLISPDGGACQFFFPYSKTKLYEVCKEKGLLKNREEMAQIYNLRTRPAIKMTKDQERECIKFNKKINSYFLRQRDGFVTYYFLKPLWKLSKFLKTKSRIYARFIGSLKKKLS